MRVILLNGSPKANGNTATALKEMEKVFQVQNVETEFITVGNQVIRGCTGCGSCYKTGKCVFDDFVNELAEKLQTADGLVIGTPVYFASPNGTLLCLLDRLFYGNKFPKLMMVGASVAAARRGGLTATTDVLNKYFLISGMPVASGQYWNGIHGALPGEASGDGEGLQMMRTLANNMIFLMKSIALGKEQYGLPEKEKYIRTNFIR